MNRTTPELLQIGTGNPLDLKYNDIIPNSSLGLYYKKKEFLRILQGRLWTCTEIGKKDLDLYSCGLGLGCSVQGFGIRLSGLGFRDDASARLSPKNLESALIDYRPLTGGFFILSD